ncbi:delphilin-like [Dorcoceras hygrometricum]|uniref:Delphilin-like n=1 Tax=Dorcoceras hygrometricum TaxID=472368 RepID=A0A2Z7BMU4_9LAMI|nr:delphilin-like [Dorcoceras hygrometricum]
MASAYCSNTVHIDFASVLDMENPGIVSMINALMASGLEGFLGCPAVIYESELVDFFNNGSVRDGLVVSTVKGVPVEFSKQLFVETFELSFLGCPAVIYESELVDFFNNGSVRDGLVVSTVKGVPVEFSKQLFVETFELSVDGLADLSDMPKDKIFDARSIVSLSGEPVSLSGRKGQMEIECRLLCDIMAKAISVKAGSFNALTVEKFSLLTAVVCGIRMNWASILFNILKKMVSAGSKQAKGFSVQIRLLLESIPNLELGESMEFPASKILTDKTVHRYISFNDKVGVEEAADAPPMKKAPRKPAVSTKRPAIATTEEPVPKKKRTSKKKSGSSSSPLEIVVVAQEAVPLQMVEPSTGVPTAEEPVEQPAAEEDISADQPVDKVTGVVGVEEVAAEIDASADRDKPADTTEERQWFDLSHEELIAKWAAERLVATPDDTDEEIEAERPVFELVEAVSPVVEVCEAATDKDFLLVDDPDTVINQVLHQLDSILADKDDKSSDRAATWFDSALDEMLRNDEGAKTMDVGTNGGDQQGYRRKGNKSCFGEKQRIYTNLFRVKSIASAMMTLSLRGLPVCEPVFRVAPRQSPVFALRVSQFCSVFIDFSLFSWLPTADITDFLYSIALDRTAFRSGQIAQNTVSVAPSVQMLDEPSSSDSSSDNILMDFADQDTNAAANSLPAATTPDVTNALNQLSASIDQIHERDDDGAKTKDKLLLHLSNFENQVIARLDAQDRVLGALCKASNDQRNLLSLELQSSHKKLGAQIVTTGLDVVEVRRVVKETHQEFNAKINSLDEQVAATRNDLLEFSAQAQQTLSIITNQLSELVAYVNRGGDAKKGEGSSSRP